MDYNALLTMCSEDGDVDDDPETFNCDECGAPLGMDEGDTCPVCGGVLDDDDSDFAEQSENDDFAGDEFRGGIDADRAGE